jgi:hypothetical protein
MDQPVSQLTVEFETYLGELLVECLDADQWEYDRNTRLAQAVQDMRGSLTNMNVRLYLLEHAHSDQHSTYISSMKHSVDDLMRIMEDLDILSRQKTVPADDIPVASLQ